MTFELGMQPTGKMQATSVTAAAGGIAAMGTKRPMAAMGMGMMGMAWQPKVA